MVNEYDLGIWIGLDSEDALIGGIRQWLASPLAPAWDRYERENSWLKNADNVARGIFEA
jgi:hypothetical protein